MKLNDYVNNQLILSKYQIKKNKKISREFKRAKVYNSFRQVKHNKFNSFETLKNEEHLLNDENKLFLKLYLKTKKLYPTKITETFKDLINQYNENNYKIPDLSDKKNLFNLNPLLLEGTELINFFRINNMNKKTNKKQKHINFIKKEMLMIESINYNKSNNLFYDNNIRGVVNKSLDHKNSKKEMNYFRVDNIWDKIDEEKKRIKREKLNKRILKQKKLTKIKKDIQIDVINSNISNKIKDENYSTDIEKVNTLNSLSPIKNNNTITNYNSKDTMSSKKFESNNNENKLNTMSIFKIPRSYEINKTLAHKKIKFKLLKEENENKLLKEIEETKNTLNNDDLMERHNTLENYTKKHLTTKILKDNIKKTNNEHKDNSEKNSKNKRLSEKKKNFSKFFSQRLKTTRFLNLFGYKIVKQSIFKKITEEKDPKKILDIYMKLKLNIFSHSEIEDLIKLYYKKVMSRSQESINKIINLKLGDELICELLEKYIKRSKEKFFKYSTNEKVNRSLNKANEDIKALKRRYLIGKSLEILD